MDSEIENCQTCLLPQVESDPSSLTQWKSVCRCSLTYSPNAKYTIEFCANCKKRVMQNSASLVNHPDLCSCQKPNPKVIPAFTKQKNDPEPIELDLASVGIESESFPTERYKPIGLLGQDSKADVILCRDLQLGKKVAVKCFKKIGSELYGLFEQEAKKNTKLVHTNIARIIDSGVLNSKTPYLVTEYKEGFNLSHYLSVHGVPTHDVATMILISLCEVITYANKEGFYHSNIKPANIIFMDDLNSEPSAVVTDFSLSKVKEKLYLTETKDAHYMSGDEARNLDYDERSEMYSIGCIGYSLLTGKTPFQTDSVKEIRNSHALKLPERISNINFDNARPKDLEEVIERCLEKNPRDRFETVPKLLERLEVFPKRKKFQLAQIQAAKKKQQLLKIAVAALAIIALISITFFVLGSH